LSLWNLLNQGWKYRISLIGWYNCFAHTRRTTTFSRHFPIPFKLLFARDGCIDAPCASINEALVSIRMSLLLSSHRHRTLSSSRLNSSVDRIFIPLAFVAHNQAKRQNQFQPKLTL
jgi:hypothetical protein